MKSLIIALLAASSAFAQTPGPDDRVWTAPDFGKCGVITRLSGNLIPDGCLQSDQNVYFDEDGSMRRRGGYAAYNITACTGSQAIRGLWGFSATDGQKYLVAYSSNSMYYSPGDGSCSVLAPYTNVGWNLSSTAEMECVQSQGSLYCTNGTDTPFYTNITSSAPLTQAPAGKHIGAFRNRIIISGVAGNLTNVYMSGELGATDWTLPALIFSTSPVVLSIAGTNDGMPVNCLLGEFQNQFLVGRDYDIYGISGYDTRDFTVRRISEQIGCIEPKSVQEVNNRLIWISKRGVESLTGTQIEPISYYIRPDIAQIIAAAGNSRSQTLTSQSDFTSGNLCGSGPNSCLSATISPGNLIPSSATIIDYSINIVMSSMTASAENFVTSSYLGAPNFWTAMGSNFFSQNSNGIYWNSSDSNGTIQTTIGVNFPYHVFTHTYDNSGGSGTGQCEGGFSDPTCFRYQFYNTGNNGYSMDVLDTTPCSSDCTPKTVRIMKITNGTRSTLASGNITYTFNFPKTYYIHHSSFGFIEISTNSNFSPTLVSATDTSFQSSTFTSITLGLDSGAHYPNYIKNWTGFSLSTSIYTSQIFDTSFSTPAAGYFTANIVVPSSTSVSYAFRQSTSPNNDFWGASVVASTNNVFPINGKRYVQYVASFTTAGIMAPTPAAASLLFEATGYYISPCIQVSSPTSYGTLSVNGVNGGGSLSFWTSTGATCSLATASTAPWVSQSPNAQISVTTATQYIAERVLYSMSSSTNVPTINDMTFNWNNGGARPPTASLQYNDRYYLFYTTGTTGTPRNDHAAVYDFNEKWTFLDDIGAYSAVTYLNQPYIGDSASTGKIFQLESGQSDNGGSFGMSFKTADLSFGEPAQVKQYKRVYVMLSAPPNQSQNVSMTCNYVLDGSSTTYSLGNYNLSLVPEITGYGVAKFNFPIGQQTQGHWINLACSYVGSEGPVKVYGIKMVYAPIVWE